MGIIWEKADYLIRLLFIIVLGIACILIVIAPLYGHGTISRNLGRKAEPEDCLKRTREK